MPEQATIEDLSDNIKQYVSTNYELVKLEAAERISMISSSLISYFIVGFVGSLFILFLSVGIGFYISSYRGDTYSGFVMVAGFYFLLTLIFVITRKNGIEKTIRNKIIQNLFDKD